MTQYVLSVVLETGRTYTQSGKSTPGLETIVIKEFNAAGEDLSACVVDMFQQYTNIKSIVISKVEVNE